MRMNIYLTKRNKCDNKIELFEKFLTANKVYANYYAYIINKNINIPRNIKRVKDARDWLVMNDPKDYIDGAFWWHDTPQGHDFWEKLNEKWKTELRRHGYEVDYNG